MRGRVAWAVPIGGRGLTRNAGYLAGHGAGLDVLAAGVDGIRARTAGSSRDGRVAGCRLGVAVTCPASGRTACHTAYERTGRAAPK
jgi:hypothetical protein